MASLYVTVSLTTILKFESCAKASVEFFSCEKLWRRDLFRYACKISIMQDDSPHTSNNMQAGFAESPVLTPKKIVEKTVEKTVEVVAAIEEQVMRPIGLSLYSLNNCYVKL